MFKNTINLARRLGRDLKNNRVAQGAGLLAVSGASFAQTGGDTIDTTTMLAAIAAGLAAALVVSISMSSAKISVRASKLPRAGA